MNDQALSDGDARARHACAGPTGEAGDAVEENGGRGSRRGHRRLAARRYDLLIHLTESWRGAWLARVLRPRWAVAPEHGSGGRRWRNSFTHLVPDA